MKTGIHPTYHENITITCSCGNTIIAGSTREKITTEICSACHPFYTGQKKLVDTAGRVDKFLAKVKKAQELKEKKVKMVEEGQETTAASTETKAKKATSKTATKGAKGKKKKK